jgi:hypothetical protein
MKIRGRAPARLTSCRVPLFYEALIETEAKAA